MKSVAIVIPAYNEAPHIGKVIDSIPKMIQAAGKRYKTTVIVVDDCSRDDTSGQASAHGATVMRHVINSGAGAATRTGVRYAMRDMTMEFVVTIDADGQHSSDDITRLVAFAIEHEADLVVGNRLHIGNKATMPLHRILGNKGLSFISRALFGITSEDTQSGLRLFRRRIVPTITAYTIDRYGFCTEMLWLARKSQITIHEMPISVSYSEETLAKGQSNWGVVHLVLDLLWIRVSR